MTVQTKPISRPWWSYLRLSVRSLIVLVLLIGAWLGWLVRSAQFQREAVAAIQKDWGHSAALYDWELENGSYNAKGKPWGPKWLVDRIGVDYFGHVVAVLRGEVSDAELAHIGCLSGLENLGMPESPGFTEAGLSHLRGLARLQRLYLWRSAVTDAGLVHLEGLTNLRYLDLSETYVTDAGLVHLKGLTNLAELDLGRTRVTDAGLVHLKGLTNLAELDLIGTQVTDAGLAHLKGLTRLSVLCLGGTQVTDVGVQGLQKALPHAQIIR